MTAHSHPGRKERPVGCSDALQPVTEVDRVRFVCSEQSLITLSHVSACSHTHSCGKGSASIQLCHFLL